MIEARWGRAGEPMPELRREDKAPALQRAVVFATLLLALLAGVSLGFYALVLALAIGSTLAGVRAVSAGALALEPEDAERLENLVRVACDRLRLARPPVHVRPKGSLNAYATGLCGCEVVVLHSELLRRMPPDELLFVIGHELGHIKFGHTAWLTPTSPLRSHPFAWAQALLRFVFNNWALETEYTADRAGLRAAGSPESAVRALSRVWLGELRAGAFVSSEARGESPTQDVLTRLAEQLGDHPFLEHRIEALAHFAATSGSLPVAALS